MVDNKSDVDRPTPFATESTSAAEVSTAAGGSVGHSTSSHHHHHHHEAQADIPADEQITGHLGSKAPSATEQAFDRAPAEGGVADDDAVTSPVPDEAPDPEQL